MQGSSPDYHKRGLPHILFLLSIWFLLFPKAVLGYVSANVPIEHWGYAAIDKLIGRELVDSSLVGTRPFTRLEMARLIEETLSSYEQHKIKNKITSRLLSRLQTEFADELNKLKYKEDGSTHSFFKPLEDPYFRFIYGDEAFDLENQHGDVFSKGANYRLGFTSRLAILDHLGVNIHPEIRYQRDITNDDYAEDIKLIEGYLKLNIANLEFELGRDSLWWGPGRHGSLLMSNNAEPFDMIKISNPCPSLLPWLLKYLGPFKFVAFLTELEKEREIPEAKLAGIRLNFKPHPILEIGFSRTIMLGGKGREKLDSSDYWKVFLATEENKPGKLDNNQLAGIDFSLSIPRVDRVLPLASSITLYGDIAGEDEAGGGPSRTAYLGGLYLGNLFLTGRTDLRAEYANNHISGYSNLWYSHHVYKSGYTYEGRIIGHHMGTDAEDLFVELTHYLTPDLLLGLAFDIERRGLDADVKQTKTYGELDLSFWGLDDIELEGSYRYEYTKNFIPGDTEDNHIIILGVVYNF